MARTAIIFDNFGPYHLVRLEAAARVCNLLAIEVNDMSPAHFWNREYRSCGFQAVTLARGDACGRLEMRELSVRLHAVFVQFKPQVVFLPGWSGVAAFVAQHWCGVHSVPSVIMSESNSWDEKRGVIKEWVKRRLACMYSAALVGGTTHKQYITELGMPSERILMGYDAVDNDYFAVEAEKSRNQEAENRKQHDLPEKYFLASARFVEKKNLARLIQAYARYRVMAEKVEGGKQKAGIWDLVLLGDGPLKSDLCQLISDLGLRNSVLLPGFKQYNELPVYYALAAAFVHASTTEQWGLVVNEAMASGLPVLVANRCGCATDLVQNGVNGFTFDPYNVEQMAQLMFQVSAFPPFKLSAFGSASQRLISSWGPDRFANGVSRAVAQAGRNAARGMAFFDKVLLRSLAIFNGSK
jgi:glycosyltransferase involved in cell wall biosynthesis